MENPSNTPTMKIVQISDTHGYHKQTNIPDGDLLIHAGDISRRGSEEEILDFLEWFSSLSHRYKIFVAGNHDWFFERKQADYIKEKIPNNVIYLNDSGVEIKGLNIWGSPIQPTFFNWAFNRERGQNIKHHWDLIPENTDILITHGPPFGILDKTIHGKHVGCKALLMRVNQINPKLHVFGHIHEEHGILKTKSTTFVNASLLNEKYQYVNNALVLNV